MIGIRLIRKINTKFFWPLVVRNSRILENFLTIFIIFRYISRVDNKRAKKNSISLKIYLHIISQRKILKTCQVRCEVWFYQACDNKLEV